VIPSDIIDDIERHCRTSFSGILGKSFAPRRMAMEFVEERRIEEQIALLKDLVRCDLKGQSLLEVGSGYGLLVAVARRRHGIHAFGLEPGGQFQGTVAVSRRIMQAYGVPDHCVVQGWGEDVPFAEGSFDVVYSVNVLEHVRDPFRVLSESVRVLRPSGHLVFVIPNYGSWWEGHYGLPMVPCCPKALFKVFVKLLGRDPAFVDTLNFIMYRDVRTWVRLLESQCELMTVGQDIWEDRMRTLAFSEWAALGTLKKLLRVVAALRLTEPIIWVGRRLHWETPFVLVLRKRSR